MKRSLIFAAIFISFFHIYSQEALKSVEEEYYDFLALQGITERPTLNYRTLSDSEWKFKEISVANNKNIMANKENTVVDEENAAVDEENAVVEPVETTHPWQNNNLGTKRTIYESDSEATNWFTKGIERNIKLKIYGPEWFNSYNTAAPYGQNDGGLWQGKGYNTSLTGGVRVEGFGFEGTIKPQVSWSQNRGFDLMPSAYDSEFGYFWGYGNNQGADAPQRFGDKSFWNFDWGDTEIRYSWKNFTVGFGTQAIWLGPAYLNPMLHSNNAPTYPKIDIGLRKTNINLFGIDFGDIEGRIWTGKLTESDYFDNNEGNNANLINGFTVSYSPSILKGLTLSANKVCISKWNLSDSIKYFNPLYSTNEEEDQKISISADWLIPEGGIEVYGELGIDDQATIPSTMSSISIQFWHTAIYTVGMKKSFSIPKNDKVKGEFIFEWNNSEMSQDMQFQWPYSFGFHHIITQGYTNKGQWLGMGSGYGGQSQFFGFNFYYPKGNTLFFFHRNQPDNNFLFREAIYGVSEGEDGELHIRNWRNFKTNMDFGFYTNYFVDSNFRIGGGFTYDLILKPLYYNNGEKVNKWTNFNISLSAKYNF